MSYLKQIEQLIALQRVDDEIHLVTTEIKEAPQELENLRAKVAIIEEKVKKQQEKMEHLEDQEKRLGIEIKDDSSRIKKSKGKLMQVENTKEYHAMVREMDSLEKIAKDREDEKKLLIDEIILQKEIKESVDAEYAEIMSKFSEFEASLKERLSVANSKHEELLAKRLVAAREVSDAIFSRYEFIRERLSHPVIVPVDNGICSGCHISIPPQKFVELQKGVQILSCPNCQRLVFWKEHFNSDNQDDV